MSTGNVSRNTNASPRLKQLLAAVATAVILGAAVLAFRGSRSGPGTLVQETGHAVGEALDTPSSVVSAMLDAARAGDVERYLDCFAGEPRQQIEAQLRETISAERFAAELRAPTARLKGYSVSDSSEREPGIVELTAEQIFDGYTNTFRVEVTRIDGVWKITSFQSTGRTANRYGQPAVAMPAEEP